MTFSSVGCWEHATMTFIFRENMVSVMAGCFHIHVSVTSASHGLLDNRFFDINSDSTSVRHGICNGWFIDTDSDITSASHGLCG